MKKTFQTIGVPLLLSAIRLYTNGCTSSHETSKKQVQSVYQCPMDCEAGKTYKEPGSCAVCGMPIELVKEE
ncbi:MAG TPA: hypothetical protein EYM84_05310 [Flavobacteriales bacterium]|nr:hypothetical protein [Flavobacteriales bacterium]